MDGRYNTESEATEELKNALGKSKPSKNPNMSEAEARMKFESKKK